MANICTTIYKVVSENRAILRELEDTINNAAVTRPGKTCPELYLEDFYRALGFDPANLSRSGELISYGNRSRERFCTTAGETLEFMVESKWNRQEDVEAKIVEKYGDAVKVFFMEEELGCDVFCTNDADGRYFSETVIIDVEDGDTEYYTPEDAVTKLQELLGCNFSSLEEVKTYAEEYNDELDESGETGHIWIHIVDIVESNGYRLPCGDIRRSNREHLFTVNDSGKKVKFAPGNLFWDGEKFAFEEHQYDFPKRWNPNHVGHFFWAGFRQGGNADAVIDETYDDPEASVNDTFFAADGGVMENWTVLSKDEWNYIIENHLGKKQVNIAGVNCAVLVPDGVEASVVNGIYTAEQWADAEEQYGLVALPLAGFRDGTSVDDRGSCGFYWSATPYSSSSVHAYLAYFNSSNTYTDWYYRYYGRSVRLVSVVQ